MILLTISQVWNAAWPAGLIMLGLGLGFAIVLLIASERLKVKVDPQVEQIYAVLPHVEHRTFSEAGHGPAVSHPHEYVKSITEFITRAAQQRIGLTA